MLVVLSVQIVRKRSKSLDFQRKESLQRSKSLDLQTFEAPLLLDWTPQPTESVVSRPTREGIGWDVSPTSSLSSCGVDSDLLQSITPSRVVENTSSFGMWEFDPLLRLKVYDAVLSDGRSFFSVKDCTFPSSPVAIQGSSLVTLKDDVVRVWDIDTKSLTKSVRLSKGGDELVTAFAVNWESEAVGMARKGGLVSIVNLESAAYANCYETQQSVLQAVHFSSNSVPKTMFTGQFSNIAMAFCTIYIHSFYFHECSLRLTCVHGLFQEGQQLRIQAVLLLFGTAGQAEES